MIISYLSHLLDPTKLYSAGSEMWAVEELLTHSSIGLYAVKMRKVDLKTWTLGEISRTFDKYYFLEGSGFGGGPYFYQDFFYRIKNGAIYRDYDITEWGLSSSGRALPLQGRGDRFKSDRLHHFFTKCIDWVISL